MRSFFFYLHIFRKVLTFLYLFGICIYANQHVASQNEQHFTEEKREKKGIELNYFSLECVLMYTWVNGPAGDKHFLTGDYYNARKF